MHSYTIIAEKEKEPWKTKTLSDKLYVGKIVECSTDLHYRAEKIRPPQSEKRIGCADTALVEMTGIEPVSENLSAQLSTSVVCH